MFVHLAVHSDSRSLPGVGLSQKGLTPLLRDEQEEVPCDPQGDEQDGGAGAAALGTAGTALPGPSTPGSRHGAGGTCPAATAVPTAGERQTCPVPARSLPEHRPQLLQSKRGCHLDSTKRLLNPLLMLILHISQLSLGYGDSQAVRNSYVPAEN